ncbi:MAG: nitroreductase family protein [Deltaproteobacteria bacterium]
MDCLEALMGRRSIRRYKDDPVGEADILTILEAARLAPSAGNLQPCSFVVVRDPATRAQVREAAFNQELLATAPVVIIVCVDPERSSYYGERGMNYYCMLDGANATQNILLAAYALGYGSCWMGGFNEAAVKKVIKLPDGMRVVSLVPLGVADESPVGPPRRELNEIVRWETWQD